MKNWKLARLRAAGFRSYLIENLYTYAANLAWWHLVPLRFFEDIPLTQTEILLKR